MSFILRLKNKMRIYMKMINQTNYIKDFIEVLNKIDYKIVIQISNILINSFNNGGKVIACGNGGSTRCRSFYRRNTR